MNNIVKQIYNESNDIWGYPQEYKGIEFYPLRLKDSKYINLFYQLFTYPKSYIPDRQIAKMSYLKFILFRLNPMGDWEETLGGLADFLKFITKKERINIDSVENIVGIDDPLLALNLKVWIDNIEFSEVEFDNIREIVLEQNGTWIEYIEEFHPELEEHLKLLNKSSESFDFKDEVFVFSSLMNLPINQIENITLYQLKIQLEKLIMIKNYEIIKPLEVSGQIKAKNGGEIVQNYLTHNARTGRYDSVKLNEEGFVANSGLEDERN